MKEDNKVAIIVGVVGAIATVISGIGGAVGGINHANAKHNEYLQSQIVHVQGDNNNVSINDIDDLVNEYNSLLDRNKSLEAQNSSYFSDLTDAKNQIESLETQIGKVPQISFKDLGLILDAQDVAINKNSSMVTIDGKDYFSKEITEKLIPNNKNMTIKDSTIFIGTVVANKAKLFDQWVVNKKDCSSDFSGNDSYGNPRTNSLIFTHYGGEIVYNLNREYAYLKCTVSVHQDYPIDSNITLTIIPDTGETRSFQITKTTEPFEIEMPINNCSLLTIDCDASSRNSSIIISNAVVYN